jgi:glycine betaine/proline transport system permease protein
MYEFPETYEIPFGEWVERGVDWLVDNAIPVFEAIQWPIDQVLSSSEGFLLWLPWWVVILGVVVISFLKNGSQHFGRLAEGESAGTVALDVLRAGWKLALLTGGFLLLTGALGYWDLTMSTLSMILTALAFCIIIGVPLGILAARNDTMDSILRPVLDAMQTIHPFVYLVPVVMLFGTGPVPGTLATIVFALPPIVRLTNLGIRQVSGSMVEAGEAFGANGRQLLFEVQLPVALPTIMAGLNQTLMLALSMVVIVALIAGGGLGQEILRAVGRLDIARAASAGLAVLLLAIVLDRISQVGKRATAAT